jgi:speckle-type POZ protein
MENFVDLGPSSVTMVFGQEEVEEVRCHSFPLAARSPVFRAMLTAEMLERRSGRIHMADMSAATGKQLLYYLYTGRLRQQNADPRELLAAADKYEIADLKDHCEAVLSRTISDANCVDLLVLGDLCGASMLKELALEHILQNRRSLVRRPQWDRPLQVLPALFREMVERVFTRDS